MKECYLCGHIETGLRGDRVMFGLCDACWHKKQHDAVALDAGGPRA